MEYIEITVNKSHHFKTSDAIHETLSKIGYDAVLISNEVSPTTNETHFHVLIKLNDNQENNINESMTDLYDSINIIPRYVKNLNATIIYFIKDGKYKLYNQYVLPSAISKQKLDFNLLIQDIMKGLTYHDLCLKYGMVILKNAYGINQLIRSINDKIINERS